MTDPEDDLPPPPHSRLRRLRKLARWCGGAVAMVVLVLFVGRWQVGRVGQRELDRVTQRLDAEEPGWRLDAILAERARHVPPPANEDLNARVLALAGEVPEPWNEWQEELTRTRWQQGRAHNHRPDKDGLAHAAKMAEPTRTLRDRAVDLRRAQRPGTYPLTVGPDPVATLLPHLAQARRVVAVLEYDARWEALHGNPNRGIAAARAALAVARSFGDEPVLLSQMTRFSCARAAADSAMQTLAWGEPTDELAELQAELLTEADVPWFRYGMRGERAMLDHFFTGVENETIPLESLFNYAGFGAPEPAHYVAFRAYKALLPGDRAKCLEICSQCVAVSNLPPHEQLPALKKIQISSGPPIDIRYTVMRRMIPAFERIAERALQTRADLLAASVCLACERHRIKTGRFPRELAELVPAFLPAVPVGPFDCQPPVYRVYPDRVAVTYFWPNSPPSSPSKELDESGTGQRAGYQLWNPDQRRAPAEEMNDP
ncbi:hypothetical protein R5W24_000657 [Gemmata sp. JC717]|uniref:hypothetical protein n=1 Tax=Gemmata algarum TaxID=2975278 RepID=UPI0021BB361D|nr:hypothetical protein [Gemmata algarum]MDY3551579.1 hypothetical protein [Gemmata algarum]